MPDHSSTPPDGQVSTGELNLDQPVANQPRMKRRSLKPKPVSAATPLPDEPKKEPTGFSAPPAAKPATPGVVIHPETPASTSRPASNTSMPSAATTRPAQPMYRTSAPAPNPSSNPNPYRSTVAPGSASIRSSDERREKEDVSTMKSTTPASTSSPSSSFAPRSTASSTSSSTATGAPYQRSGSVTDYRANIERQAREQKSIGGIINYIVYALAAFLVLSAALAGYGAYVLSKQIHHQSVTLADLDTRYSEQNRELTSQLKAVDDTLTDALNQTRAQVNRQQEIILHQQESINTLTAQNTKLAASEAATEATLRQERQYRAYETASLRTRVHALEDLNHPQQ